MSSALENEWRCAVCNKVKDLRGPHLDGKSTVRSDCWPCAKKQTFKLVSSTEGAKKEVPQFLFSQQPAAAAAAPQSAPAKQTGVSSPFAAKPAAAAPPAAASPFVSAFATKPASSAAAPAAAASPFGSFGGGKTGNPFAPSSQATVKAGSPPNPFGQTAAANPFVAAAGSTTTATSQQIVMQNNAPTPGKGKPAPSPPFAFVSKPPLGVPPTFSLSPGAPASSSHNTTTTTMTADDQWKCNACNKNKELRGPHLDNKSTVRSDCWPCAKKQTFQRFSASGERVTSAATVATKPAAAAAPQIVRQTSTSPSPFVSPASTLKSSQAPQSAKSFQTPLEPFSTTDTLRTSSSFTMTPVAPYQKMRPSAFAWREPEVPSYEAERQFFVQAVACAAGISPCTPSNPGGEISLSSIFFERTIQSYLDHIRSGVFTKSLPMVWGPQHDVVFVMCSHFLSKVSSPILTPSPALYSGLGDVASVLMHLDATIGAGSSERIGRVFCPDTVTLAATALYQLHVNHDFAVFGPTPDKTTKPTLLDDIIEILPVVQTRVTSGDQRNAASKQLWQSCSISAMPLAAQGDAIRRNEPGKPKPNTVDVVLITKYTTADEASQFRLLIA